MRFASCEHAGRRFAAAVEDDRVIPLDGVAELGAATDRALLADPPLLRDEALPAGDVHLRPAIPRPGKIICLGLNYRSHVDETKRELPQYPVMFTKFPEALIGPADDIVCPPESEQVDFEAELGVVVGGRLRRASEDEAIAAVAGYVAANDVTMRDFQYRSHQWLQGKTWSRSTPIGPHLVTPDEVGDPGTLAIRLELNGAEMQSASTSALIFGVPRILAMISEFTTLEPGDLVLTGTPGGVGYRRDPQVFLRPGDRVRVEIERVGVLDNGVVAEGERG
jgi:acylpyruvate hydrolase